MFKIKWIRRNYFLRPHILQLIQQNLNKTTKCIISKYRSWTIQEKSKLVNKFKWTVQKKTRYMMIFERSLESLETYSINCDIYFCWIVNDISLVYFLILAWVMLIRCKQTRLANLFLSSKRKEDEREHKKKGHKTI